MTWPTAPGQKQVPTTVDPMPAGKIANSTPVARNKVKNVHPDNNWGLGVAKVVNVDYEEYQVTLRTLVGATDHQRVPVPITFPGAGARHFLGTMPQVGDLCVVGWMPQESSEKGKHNTKTPVILNWIVPGTWAGRDWLTTSDFGPDEYDPMSPKDRALMAGAHEVQRHKLRHIQPGNIVASSAQGSDLVLDESILLANRRGNEIRLRDQDQALVIRSLQQFHAMAGVRSYSGMVQRDATFLPTTMVSDGKDWAPLQTMVDGEVVTEDQLVSNPQAPKGFLTPASVLSKTRNNTGKGRSLVTGSDRLDPYSFLQRGGFISDTGFVTDSKATPNAQYGGKPIFRVASSMKGDNATLDPKGGTLTEFRIEVTHTSDGRLPVTEQTDMFDADRLPSGLPGDKPGLPPSNVPFIEWVMGSVVGNDPFSQEGRKKYGMPLVARIFDEDRLAPRLDAAVITATGASTADTDIGDHMATLFRMVPPLLNSSSPGTFWGVNKQGQFKASIAGSPTGYSAEVAMAGSLKIGLGGGMRFISDGHIEWVTRSKSSLHLTAEEGAVVIYGAGPVRNNSAAVERDTGSGGGEADLPAVDIVAKTNARIKADRQIALQAEQIVGNASDIELTANASLELNGVKKVAITASTFVKTVSSQAQESYTGPNNGSPANFPLHERTYAPMYPGLCERVTYQQGDRQENFNLGSHKTTILIGDMTYETNLGSWTARALNNTITLSATGMATTVPTGVIALTAAAGTATMSGFAGVSIIAAGGTATVRGGTGVYLGGPVTEVGSILVSGSLEPFTGLPFATWALGAKHFNIGI